MIGSFRRKDEGGRMKDEKNHSAFIVHPWPSVPQPARFIKPAGRVQCKFRASPKENEKRIRDRGWRGWTRMDSDGSSLIPGCLLRIGGISFLMDIEIWRQDCRPLTIEEPPRKIRMKDEG
jgi:hypothetical protein